MVRFDQPCRNTWRALNYFSQHMARGDYLTQQGQSEMVWTGEGAARLGLSGQATPEQFARLCAGKDPFTGKRLGVRDKGAARRVCFFGQISAPKDVSLIHLVGGDRRVAGWWEEAVRETLHEIEDTVQARVRAKGANYDRATRNMVAAVVTHDASRSLDPQLHTHVCVMNVTYDELERRWKGVQPSGFYAHQGYFREVCYNKLAEKLLAAGYELERARKIGFTIKGVPVEVRQRFSKRREEIESLAREQGVTSQNGLQDIASRSRAAKRNVDPAVLRERWKTEAGEELPAVEAAVADADGVPKPTVPVTPDEALDYAVAHVFERVSVADRRALLREALVHGRGHVPLDALKAAVAGREEAKTLLRHEQTVTSREMLLLEKEFTGWAAVGRGTLPRLGDGAGIASSLTRDQAAAARKILASRDRVVGLAGDAGTGKTTTLKEVVRGIVKGVGRVFACAPSSGATDVLRRELTPEADTLQQLLVNRALQEQLRGAVILVDEAGLISTRQMYDLCETAQRNGNRLLLVGDIKQHGSVEAGDAFRAMQKFGGIEQATLTEIMRQAKAPLYLPAVEFLAKGDAHAAFAHLDRIGAVHEIKEPDLLFDRAARDYVKTLRSGQSCLAISPVWSEIHRFTALARRHLREAGFLQDGEQTVTTFVPFQWTRAEQQDARNYQPGDRLHFHRDAAGFLKGETVRFVERRERQLVVERAAGERAVLSPSRTVGFEVGLDRDIAVSVGERLLIRSNHRPAALQNGDIVEVAGFGEDGTIRLRDGRTIPPAFRQFAYGYATTSHASQGKTVDRGIVVMSDSGIRAANLKQAYVSNSRFRQSQVLYVSDRKAAREAMATEADRQLALELREGRGGRWKLVQKIAEAAEVWKLIRDKAVAARNALGWRPRHAA